MTIIFIVILISILSSYVFILNDQLACSFDILVQVEKSIKKSYELEFIVYYILAFYKENYQKVSVPFERTFDIVLPSRSLSQLKVNGSGSDNQIDLLVSLYKKDAPLLKNLIKIHLERKGDGAIKLKSYYIE